jgi:sugar phosphate isomerase/epimerase
MIEQPKLGISLRSLMRDASDIEDRISEVAVYRPDSIELSCFSQDLIRDGIVLKERAESIRRALDIFGIRSTMHGPLSFNLLDRPEHLVQHVATGCAYLDLGAILGITAMVIHAGYCAKEDSATLRSKYNAQRDGLKKLADYAGQYGILVYIENIFPFFKGAHTALPEKLAEEIQAIGHPQLVACFDVSHAYIACNAYGASLLDQAKIISNMAPHWHVHDSFGRPSTSLTPYTQSECLAYGIGDLHLAVGDGDLPWSDILTAVTLMPETTFNIELHPELWSDMPRCVNATRELILSAEQLQAV